MHTNTLFMCNVWICFERWNAWQGSDDETHWQSDCRQRYRFVFLFFYSVVVVICMMRFNRYNPLDEDNPVDNIPWIQLDSVDGTSMLKMYNCQSHGKIHCVSHDSTSFRDKNKTEDTQQIYIQQQHHDILCERQTSKYEKCPSKNIFNNCQRWEKKIHSAD